MHHVGRWCIGCGNEPEDRTMGRPTFQDLMTATAGTHGVRLRCEDLDGRSAMLEEACRAAVAMATHGITVVARDVTHATRLAAVALRSGARIAEIVSFANPEETEGRTLWDMFASSPGGPISAEAAYGYVPIPDDARPAATMAREFPEGAPEHPTNGPTYDAIVLQKRVPHRSDGAQSASVWEAWNLERWRLDRHRENVLEGSTYGLFRATETKGGEAVVVRQPDHRIHDVHAQYNDGTATIYVVPGARRASPDVDGLYRSVVAMTLAVNTAPTRPDGVHHPLLLSDPPDEVVGICRQARHGIRRDAAPGDRRGGVIWTASGRDDGSVQVDVGLGHEASRDALGEWADTQHRTSHGIGGFTVRVRDTPRVTLTTPRSWKRYMETLAPKGVFHVGGERGPVNETQFSK